MLKSCMVSTAFIQFVQVWSIGLSINKNLKLVIQQQAMRQQVQLFLKEGEIKSRKSCPRNCHYLRFDPDGTIWSGTSS